MCTQTVNAPTTTADRAGVVCHSGARPTTLTRCQPTVWQSTLRSSCPAFDTYQQAYKATRDAGTAEHAMLLTKSRFRTDTT